MKIILMSLDNEIGFQRRKLINYEYELVYGNTELNNVPEEFIKKMNRMYNVNDNLFRAKVCHFYGYYEILKKIVFEKIDNVIICEDDAILKDKLPDKFNTEEILILNCELHHPTTWKKGPNLRGNTKKYFKDNILPLINNFKEGINKIEYDKFRWSCCACMYYPKFQNCIEIINEIENAKKITTFDLWLSKNKLVKNLIYPSVFKIQDNKVSQVDKPSGLINDYKIIK